MKKDGKGEKEMLDGKVALVTGASVASEERSPFPLRKQVRTLQ